MSLPNLRFPEFKDKWNLTELGKVVEFKKGSSISKADISSEGKPCILYGELYTKYGPVIREVISRTNRELINPVIGQKNDILIPSSGESAIDIACASAIDTDEQVILGGDLNVLTPLNGVNGKFISYQINGVRKVKLSTFAQGASVVHLYNNSLNKFEITLPDAKEQQKIADFLSLLDRRVEKQQAKVEALQEQKKGLLQKIFSQELRFKDEGGKAFPEWKNANLGEIGIFKSGYGFSEKYQGQQNLEYPFIKVSDMNTIGNEREITISNHSVSKEMLKVMNLKPFTEVSIVFAKVGAAIFLERKRIIKKPFLIDNNMMAFSLKNSGNIYFYKHLFQSIRLSKFAQVGALPSYNGNDLAIIKIKVPCEEEQNRISNFLSVFDQKIEKEGDKLETLQKQKKGLMQQMFI
ncbi:hypothetical protein AWM68_20110 [Fictibacillus phosphorivorans]|uniref:Type I restriction modification DNA specificity domain-containing protein n=1 Tax=Fictibacillus phosphorivorans TaxID=1221500 RepID=A0A163RHI9_9BACL|nr:restriction endonuclease subunit S [Fictibacillus phosphorivorans]KZE66877.1 hypothetical protein AWM68_20110 [Fictibacillus phosphorivorans]